ncbi:MAG: DUF4091 domain-containing protein [Victivallales bacterium]|nr:DUF4091 domain-containing protein [Victivallales bacterium]
MKVGNFAIKSNTETLEMFSFESCIVSSLEKIFCRSGIDANQITRIAGAHGELIAFQVACRAEESVWVEFNIESPLASLIQVREVGLVPCEMPAHPDDPNILSCEAGLYPDPLYPLGKIFKLSRRNWHSLWISIRIPENIPAGEYPVRISFSQHDMQYCYEPFNDVQTLNVEILPFSLPEQTLIHTEWFHTDCVMTHYHQECWSERHWTLIESYLKNMVEHGINMLLTPLWTVPLDTAEGHERPTVQLLDIEYKDGIYHFDFSRLHRWVAMAQKCGIKYFEMSHAFTQWGAKSTPKIMVKENGVTQRWFDWHVSADAPAYRDFLEQLMPQLLEELRKLKLQGYCYFHVSDEPNPKHLNSYARAVTLLRPLVEDFPIIDALSDLEFYHLGLVETPVPNTEKVDLFMQENISQRWVYYCGGWKEVPNRQFGMPSSRNRIFGTILYLYNLDAFLNWGYNFWYKQFSLGYLDPFKDTCAGRSFCGGGSFMVYPGENGPIDSIHYEVFHEGLQDLRALELLESHIGRSNVEALIHEGLQYRINIRHYPLDSKWILSMRERVNAKLSEIFN